MGSVHSIIDVCKNKKKYKNTDMKQLIYDTILFLKYFMQFLIQSTDNVIQKILFFIQYTRGFIHKMLIKVRKKPYFS